MIFPGLKHSLAHRQVIYVQSLGKQSVATRNIGHRFVAPATPATSSSTTHLSDSGTPSGDTIVWDGMHIGHMPLAGFEPVAALAPGPLGKLLQQHVFVALSSSEQADQCLLLDFLPQRPTDPATALVLLTGGSVPGDLRARRIKGWIRGKTIRTRLAARLRTPMDDAEADRRLADFNGRYDANLRLLRNDCRHYAAALLSHLTAEPYSVKDLH